jgi:hypothetical protein
LGDEVMYDETMKGKGRQQMKPVVGMKIKGNSPVCSYDLETFALGML